MKCSGPRAKKPTCGSSQGGPLDLALLRLGPLFSMCFSIFMYPQMGPWARNLFLSVCRWQKGAFFQKNTFLKSALFLRREGNSSKHMLQTTCMLGRFTGCFICFPYFQVAMFFERQKGGTNQRKKTHLGGPFVELGPKRIAKGPIPIQKVAPKDHSEFWVEPNGPKLAGHRVFGKNRTGFSQTAHRRKSTHVKAHRSEKGKQQMPL